MVNPLKFLFPVTFSDHWFKQQNLIDELSDGKILHSIIDHYNENCSQENIIKKDNLDDSDKLKKIIKSKLSLLYHPDKCTLEIAKLQDLANDMKLNLNEDEENNKEKLAIAIQQKINDIARVLQERGDISIEKSLKINSRALRITSKVVDVIFLQALCYSFLTLVIFHRKDFGYGKIFGVSIGINIATTIVFSIVSSMLQKCVKQPNFTATEQLTAKELETMHQIHNLPLLMALSGLSQRKTSFTEDEFNEIKYNLLLGKTKGLGQPYASFIINILFTAAFCATFVTLGKMNILDQAASYKAAIFFGVSLIITLAFQAVYENITKNKAEQQQQGLDQLRRDIESQFLESECNKKTLLDLYDRYTQLRSQVYQKLFGNNDPDEILNDTDTSELVKKIVRAAVGDNVANFMKNLSMRLSIQNESSTINTLVATIKVNKLFKEGHQSQDAADVPLAI